MLKTLSPALPLILMTLSSSCTLNIMSKSNGSSTTQSEFHFVGAAYPGFGDSSGSAAHEIYPNGMSLKDDVQSMAIQSDGKILMGGHTYTNVLASNAADGMIIRLNTDGSLDTSFNGTGKFFWNSASNARDIFYAIQDAGTAVFAFGFSRTSNTTASQRAVIVKVNSATGTLDTSFGTSGAIYKYTSSNGAAYYDGKVLPNGKMLAFGHAVLSGVDTYLLEKFNADGSYDTSFGTGGTVTYPSAYLYDEATIRTDSEGNILIAFLSGGTTNFKATVVRYLPNGSLDSSFGTAGVYTHSYGLANYAASLIVDGQSIYIIGAWYDTTLSDRHSMVVKLDHSGAPVASFGVAGTATYQTNVLNARLYWNDGKILNDRIYLGGYYSPTADAEFIFAAINTTTGALESDFGTQGIYSGGGATGRNIRAVTVDSTEAIVGVGPAAMASANQQVHAVKIR